MRPDNERAPLFTRQDLKEPSTYFCCFLPLALTTFVVCGLLFVVCGLLYKFSTWAFR